VLSRRSDRGTKSAARELVRETEAFLTGNLAVERLVRGEATSDWEWVNVLAHASEDRLSILAAGVPAQRRRKSDERWSRALVVLARRLLAVAAEDGASVEELQSSVLVPLELELAADHHPRRRGPDQTVQLVLERLALRR
jgi:hypothetical protein